MMYNKVLNCIDRLKDYINKVNAILANNNCPSSQVLKLKTYKQNALDLIQKCNDYLNEQNFNSLYELNQLFFHIEGIGDLSQVYFDEEYFIELTKLVKNLAAEDYEKFVVLVSIVETHMFNALDNYNFVKNIKDNLDKNEIENICVACSNHIKEINQMVSNSFSVRLKDEQPLLEISEEQLLQFKKNAVKLLSNIGEDSVYFGTSKLKNIFKSADIDKLKQLYSYYERYRVDRLAYFTNENPINFMQDYYNHNLIDFPEIIIPGSDLRDVLTQDFNSVLGRMYTTRELCSDKFSSKEIDTYKQTIAFLKNFIIYLRKNVFYDYNSSCINGGKNIKQRAISDIKNDILNLPSSLTESQTEFVMKDHFVKNLLNDVKQYLCIFKKGDIKYYIYRSYSIGRFVKEVKETFNQRLNTTQKEIMLYFLPYGKTETAFQIARLDISKENQMVHKPKGSQGGKILSKCHLHIYSENDQIFVNVDSNAKSKKPAGYEINSVLSELLDEDTAVEFFTKNFNMSDADDDVSTVDDYIVND